MGSFDTPAGTFANVLRVKRISSYQDSSYVNGTSYVGKTWETEYKWYDAAHKDFLYSTLSYRYVNPQGNESTKNSSTYVSGQQTGISDASIGKLGLKISPNPAHDYVQVSLNLTERSTAKIDIVDITGRAVYNASHNNLPVGDNQLEVPTSGLPSGVYMIRIQADSNLATNKLVIQ